MISAILDSNIYDQLATDLPLCATIYHLVEQEKFKVIVSRTIAEELGKSPFGGVPNFFPYEYVGNTVGRAGIMCAGDSIGAGDVYEEHLGNSTKANDAFIVDAASWHADWLISEDERLRKRAAEIKMRAIPMNYQEFINALGKIQPQRGKRGQF